MKLLLIISAVTEAAIGASLLILPAVTASTLLGVPLNTAGGVVAARIGGAALISLGIACWSAKDGELSGPMRGVVVAMLFYNLSAVAVLVWGGIRLELRSPLLWPTIAIHLGLAVWCTVSLWHSQGRGVSVETA